MEINITALLENFCAPCCSASVHELGEDASSITWRAARNKAKDTPLLNTPEEISTFRQHMESMGFGYDEDLDAFTNNDWNALFLQLIAGDIREAGFDSLEDVDWEAYEEEILKGDGNVSGRMYKGRDEEIYYSLGD